MLSQTLPLAARTAVHAGLLMTMQAFLPRIQEEDYATAFARLVREVYGFHQQMLSQPGVADALRAAEREDGWLLPFFLAAIPIDGARVLRKRLQRLVRLPVQPTDDFPYPDYYLTDFHNQKNGHFSLLGALTYEWQIRVLFAGANRLMRQGIVDRLPVGDGLRVLDVACGTASWLALARPQGRRHHVTGVDLSPAYLRVARLLRDDNTRFLQRNAEALDPDWSVRFDAVTCIWLLHELPRPAQERAVREMARVLRPGGTLLLMDAMQEQDLPPAQRPTHRRVGDHFARYFNEPYFKAYQRLDVPALLAQAGLRVVEEACLFRSRLWVAERA